MSRFDFFMIKDYVTSRFYLVDAYCANIMFSFNHKLSKKMDCFLSENDLKNRSDVYEDNINGVTFYKKQNGNQKPEPILTTKIVNTYIKKMQGERSKGNDICFKGKTGEELDECVTVKMVGYYTRFRDAYVDLKETEELLKDNEFCPPRDKVRIVKSKDELLQDFEGKTVWNPIRPSIQEKF